MLAQDLFENRMHDAYSVFQQLTSAVNRSQDVDLRVGAEMMPIQYWQARHLLGQYKSIARRQGPDAGMKFLSDYNAISAALDAMDTKLAAMKRVGSIPGERQVDEAGGRSSWDSNMPGWQRREQGYMDAQRRHDLEQERNAGLEHEDDPRWQAQQNRRPQLKGYWFYDGVGPADKMDAERLGLKQTKSGKWMIAVYDTSGRATMMRKNAADKAFGAGRWWAPRNEGVAEGHADQERKIFKKNGKPVGEVGIDRESSPGNGQWYMKCYAYNIDNAGYDSYEEAVEELKHCLKQGVAEGIQFLPIDKFPKTDDENQSELYLKTKDGNVYVGEWDSASGYFFATDIVHGNHPAGNELPGRMYNRPVAFAVKQGVAEGEHDSEFIDHEDSFYRMVDFAHREMRKGRSLQDVIKYLVDNNYLGFMEVGTFVKQMRGEKWNESATEAAPDPKHLQRYGHEADQTWPDDSNSLSKRYNDRDIVVPNLDAVHAGTAAPNKHYQSTPFHTNGMKIATKIKPSITKTTVDRLDRNTEVPAFLKKSVAKEDARPGPLQQTARHTQKKTIDQIDHLHALNGLEETVSLMRAANQRVTENLSLMEHGGGVNGMGSYVAWRRNANKERGITKEAGSPAQQAAIAIAMKKAGKKPKHMSEEPLEEKWSQKYKSSINCSHPKGFSQKAHCAGKKKHNEDIEMEMTCPDCGMCETHGDHSRNTLDENCWKGYHKEGNKKLFGKTVPNCVKNEAVAEEKCPHCNSPMFSELMINEKKDACYYKVKSRYKVWPSAYASGALVKCRKKGAANWGNKSESALNEFAPGSGDDGEENTLLKYARMWYNGDDTTQQKVEAILDRMGWEIGELESEEGGCFVVRAGDEHGKSYIGFSPEDLIEGQLDENLHKWFKEKWVRFGPDGKIRGDCARGDDSEGKPKCLPQSKAHALGKKGRASAAARKRREDPNPERHGSAINVATKKKSNEDYSKGMKMADYVEQIDRLHDEMMQCQHRGDDAGYERAKQRYLELEQQARRGIVPETAGTTPATMPPSPAAAKQAQAIVQKAADNRAISLANMAGVVPNNVAEGSADWPFEDVNEVSDATLASYKEKAKQSAEQLSAAGKHRAATDRYGNIMKATGRQIDRTTKNIARALGKK